MRSTHPFRRFPRVLAAAGLLALLGSALPARAAAHWSLLNLLLALLCLGLALPASFPRRPGTARPLPLAVAVGAVVALLLTTDLTLPMGLADRWTLPLALLAAGQVRMLLRRAAERLPAEN